MRFDDEFPFYAERPLMASRSLCSDCCLPRMREIDWLRSYSWFRDGSIDCVLDSSREISCRECIFTDLRC